MAGSSPGHDEKCAAPGLCKVDTSQTIRHPDGFVVCSPFVASATRITDPVVIFEIMSDDSARCDLVTKNQEYAAMPSVRRYFVLAQDAMAGTMFERIGTDWVGRLLNANSILRMPEIEYRSTAGGALRVRRSLSCRTRPRAGRLTAPPRPPHRP